MELHIPKNYFSRVGCGHHIGAMRAMAMQWCMTVWAIGTLSSVSIYSHYISAYSMRTHHMWIWHLSLPTHAPGIKYGRECVCTIILWMDPLVRAPLPPSTIQCTAVCVCVCGRVRRAHAARQHEQIKIIHIFHLFNIKTNIRTSGEWRVRARIII